MKKEIQMRDRGQRESQEQRRENEDEMKCDTGHYTGLNEACLP